jgi:hypothetical protein
MAREDDIKVIAYNIWEEEGCEDGHDCEHWFRAEVIWEDQQASKRKTAAATAAKPAAKAKPKSKKS